MPDTPMTPAAEPAAPAAPATEDKKNTFSAPFYKIEFYQQYFDVDTADVGSRILHALLPYRPNFLTTVVPPGALDLYGPFWVSTTVIFVLFAIGNLAHSIKAFADPNYEFVPDFTTLPWAATTIYLYILLVPLAVWGIFRYFDTKLSLVRLYSLIGYGLSVFIPISIICVLPWEIVKWVCTGVLFLITTLFMTSNIWVAASAAGARSTILLSVCGGLAAINAGIALLFKFVFFTYKSVIVAP
ncbi:hypothetical protein H696_03649 [Fonticula alba]|uniref:Protein YIPF n=1 Tax=Fonticula alba TaxID=691883 RepID=A0A058Z7U4_FONAL|nr:hypothetical protein H696_03649 [Fonticula alba]KCV70191.1 hypothetical protein H696_03649 [Fonticula alba]|eukprot:XP_009495797.1 hypothetical protein H696_03649 [Fonticula alba]